MVTTAVSEQNGESFAQIRLQVALAVGFDVGETKLKAGAVSNALQNSGLKESESISVAVYVRTGTTME